MKALTVRQPFASLISVGVKQIETRSWSTKYRGPLAIHAAKRPAVDGECAGKISLDGLGTPMYWLPEPFTEEAQIERGMPPDGDLHGFPMPLGAVIATCTLADVIPIVDLHDCPDGPFVYCDGDWLQIHDGPDDAAPRYSETEQLYGDYRPDRYAWLLANVRPTTARCPACGGIDCEGGPAQTYPARGKQGLWEWTP